MRIGSILIKLLILTAIVAFGAYLILPTLPEYDIHKEEKIDVCIEQMEALREAVLKYMEESEKDFKGTQQDLKTAGYVTTLYECPAGEKDDKYGIEETITIEEKNFITGEIVEKKKIVKMLYGDFETGKVTETEHDMVVLSVGILANNEMSKVFKKDKLEFDNFNYIKQIDELGSPAKTSIEGVFVSGTASGPMDIPDSILSAGAAASETSRYIKQ